MPPKGSKKSAAANPKPFAPPPNTAPTPLTPSIEEAYRRKCRQLRHRYNKIEESNDAARLRLYRQRRQIDKMRTERAFLLEQIAKRTSTNVEDSDGSPSPPPTPKDKPLRTKRGHRKPSNFPDLDLSGSKPLSSILSQSHATLSPAGSESFSTSLALPTDSQSQSKLANGLSSSKSKSPSKPLNAFELYCQDRRSVLAEEHKDKEDFNIEEELARGWKELDDKDKEDFQNREEDDMKRWKQEKEEHEEEKAAAAAAEAADAAEEEEDEDQEDVTAVVESGDKDEDDDMAGAGDDDAEKEKAGSPRGTSPAIAAGDEPKDEDVEMADSDSK